MSTVEQPPSKKRRVQKEKGRVRVTRSCDGCKKKKLRCTGTQPCSLCMQADQDCTYTAEYNRGRVPAVAVVSQNDPKSGRTTNTHSNRDRANAGNTPQQHKQRLLSVSDATQLGESDLLRSGNGENRPSQCSPHGHVQGNMGNMDNNLLPVVPLGSDNPEPGRSSHNSPEPTQTDQDGHYLGPASGISFLSRALKKLHEHVSSNPKAQESPIFSFGDAPLPPYDPKTRELSFGATSISLVLLIGSYISRRSRCGVKKFYDSINNPKPLEPGTRQIRAILLMVLAQAKRYRSPQDPNPYNAVNSTAYFAASEHHLLSETGGIRLSSIQARLAQCFYLLTQSRVNQAWSLFGTVANLALAIGLHRSKRRDVASGMDIIEHECRKRVFWSAYSLDSYLSASLGRPRSFHDDDIDQELPSSIDDSQITRTKLLSSEMTYQSVMLASTYHAKLSRIISSILGELYGIKHLSPQNQVETMQAYDSRLMQWREEIRGFLDFPKVEVMRTVYRRQHTVLQLAYSHAVILLHRPALLRRSSTNNMSQNREFQAKRAHSVQRCLEAATTIVSKLRELTEKQQMYSSFWFTHYYVFSALIALFLYVVNNRSRAAYIWKPYLDLVEQGLRDLSACATETSYAQRYVVVLTELQNEAMKSVDKEIVPILTSNGAQSSYRQSTTELQQAMSNYLAPPAIIPFGGTRAASFEESQSQNQGFNHLAVSDSGFPSQCDIVVGVDDSLTLPSLINLEDFGSLAMEGLADTEFLFLFDESHTLSA